MEASLKKKRRIEITAFRRTVTVAAGGPGAEAPPRPRGPQGLDSGPRSADDPPAHLNQADLVEAVLSTIDAGRSPELEHLIETLIVSDGGGEPAAEQTGLEPNRDYSMLCSLGVPVVRLRELLDELCKRRSLKTPKKSRRH
jgi:hypothetical protein